jgi:hypothetical protein
MRRASSRVAGARAVIAWFSDPAGNILAVHEIA